MESWRKVWRDGFAPQLSTAGLDALRHALREDDTRLIQGVTTSPPPIPCLREWAVEGACAVAFCAWQGEGFDTVGEVERQFACTCLDADMALGEPAACRYFVNWFDDTPRDQMRRLLLEEVERTLSERFPIDCAESAIPETIKAA